MIDDDEMNPRKLARLSSRRETCTVTLPYVSASQTVTRRASDDDETDDDFVPAHRRLRGGMHPMDDHNEPSHPRELVRDSRRYTAYAEAWATHERY